MTRLWQRDLLDEPDVVARRLLGATVVVRDVSGVTRRARLVEVEAYGGDDDPASHAFRGPTPRCAVMFGPPGRLYVYRSYGVHWCANVVSGPAGRASAVLLRGADILDARGRVTQRVSGPGLLARFLGLSGEDSGSSLVAPSGRAWLVAARDVVPARATGRVGLTRETARPWRFVVAREARAG